MKRKLYVIGVLWVMLIGYSCEENERYYFDRQYSALNIWLGAKNTPVDSFVYNYAYQAEHDSVIFYVRLTGMPLKEARSFSLEAVEGDIDLVDFSYADYILEAGVNEASFPLYIDKTVDFSGFKDRNGYIVFKMKENNTFVQGVEEYSRLCIILKNGVGKPENWDVATYPYQALSRYFGSYSDVKYSFIIQATGLSNFRIYYTVAQNPDLEDNVITHLEAAYLRTKCQLALQEYNNDPEKEDLRDENGELVVFP